jgi:hypothetical protein
VFGGAGGFDDALERVRGWGELVAEGAIEAEEDEDAPARDPQAPPTLTIADTITLTGPGDTPRWSASIAHRVAPDAADLLMLAARLWSRGVPVDLTLGTPGRRIHIPAYAFRRGSAGLPETRPARALPGAGTRALSPVEQRLVFYDLVHGDRDERPRAAASEVVVGPVDVERLRAHWYEIQLERPLLRTVFSRIDDVWCGVIHDRPLVDLAVGKESPADAAEPGEPLRLTDTPLVRADLTVGADGAHTLTLAACEALIDARDLGALVVELLARHGRKERAGGPLPRHRPTPSRQGAPDAT